MALLSFNPFALAGDGKAYNASFCRSQDDESFTRYPYKYLAGSDQAVFCPIIRDADGVKLPKVVVEGYVPFPGDSDFECHVWWLGEDSEELFRGISVGRSASGTGYVQVAFDSLSDYGVVNGIFTLSEQEGTMVVVCNLEAADELHHYYVEENLY